MKDFITEAWCREEFTSAIAYYKLGGMVIDIIIHLRAGGRIKDTVDELFRRLKIKEHGRGVFSMVDLWEIDVASKRKWWEVLLFRHPTHREKKEFENCIPESWLSPEFISRQATLRLPYKRG
jgi:hypothetical protein